MILLEKNAHLVLKTPSAMVFLLRVDISKQHAEIGRPNRKQTIPTLPCELPNILRLHPCGGRRFDLGHNLRSVLGRRKSHRKMDVIGNSVCPEALAAKVSCDAGKIGMKLGCAVIGDQGLPVFGAEDNVNEVEAQGLWHCADYMSGLQPSGLFPNRSLGLRPRLVCGRALGPQCVSRSRHTRSIGAHPCMGALLRLKLVCQAERIPESAQPDRTVKEFHVKT